MYNNMSPKEAARTVHLAGFLVTFPSGSSLPSSVPSLRGLRPVPSGLVHSSRPSLAPAGPSSGRRWEGGWRESEGTVRKRPVISALPALHPFHPAVGGPLRGGDGTERAAWVKWMSAASLGPTPSAVHRSPAFRPAAGTGRGLTRYACDRYATLRFPLRGVWWVSNEWGV